MNRARSSLRDSYGNPVEYDTLENIDAKIPGKNHYEPNKFIIPGYASGIFQPHEVPTRSNFGPETGRKIEDDRIHFVDPLQNTYQNSDKPIQAPLATLLPPGADFGNLNTQQSIHIPRPNIDLNETPQSPPIDDPLNHQLFPPKDDTSGGQSAPNAPSTALQVPGGSFQQASLHQDLVPPQYPNQGPGVFIPRPNLDISETPIDNSNGPLNQGLLPPNDGPKTSFSSFNNFGTTPNPFKNTGADGPVVITEVHFAPKPSNGLLPPKDPSPNDVNFQSPDAQPTASTSNKFGGPSIGGQTGNKFTGSFGGAPGILSTIDKVRGAPQGSTQGAINKFTGSFGGSSGILGGKPSTQQNPNQIPVTVIQSPPPTQTSFSNFGFPSKPPTQASFSTTNAALEPKNTVNKYQGAFGGSPGILVSDNAVDRNTGQSTVQAPTVAPTIATLPLDSRFSGTLGGIQTSTTFNAQPTQAAPQFPALSNNVPVSQKESTAQRYTGQFGGAPGILRPYDNNN